MVATVCFRYLVHEFLKEINTSSAYVTLRKRTVFSDTHEENKQNKKLYKSRTSLVISVPTNPTLECDSFSICFETRHRYNSPTMIQITNGAPRAPPRAITFAPQDVLNGAHDSAAPTTNYNNSHHNNNSNNNNNDDHYGPAHHPPHVKYQAKHLRGNLTREIKDRDPLFYYEIVAVLGAGSMGSVAKVKKRREVIGGSARKDLQIYFQREKQLKACFDVPLVGGIFASFSKILWKEDHEHHLSMSSRNNGSRRSLFCLSDREESSYPDRNVLSSPSSEDETPHNEDSKYLKTQTSTMTTTVSDYTRSTNESGERYELVCAMKSIHLNRVTDPTFVEELKNEVAILKRLDHPHIVKALETFEHRNQLFIVMELCSGGDLYTRDPYTEAEAARIVSGIASAISYMHSKDICHRDLKYENILFVNDSPLAEVKLIDFGLSRKFVKNEQLNEGVGTIYTMAPEVLKGSYSKEADLWSLGVITYMLLSSQMPFYGRKRRDIVEKIMKGSYEMRGRRWKRVGQQAKAFVEDLLCVDPYERMTADEAYSASWLNCRTGVTVRNPYEEELQSANQSILAYSKYSKIKKIALLICAHKATTTEIGILRKVFQRYDTERNGILSYEEFKAALRDIGYSEEEYRNIFDAVDLDGTGKIRYTEFLAATIEAQGAISEERLAEAFDRMDSDDSGYITKENLRELLGDEIPESEIDAIIDEADLTQDGRISYSEFLALWGVKQEDERLRSLDVVKQMWVESGRSSDSEDSRSKAVEKSGGPEYMASRMNFVEGKRSSERKVIEAAKQVAKQVVETASTCSTVTSPMSASSPSRDETTSIATDQHVHRTSPKNRVLFEAIPEVVLSPEETGDD